MMTVQEPDKIRDLSTGYGHPPSMVEVKRDQFRVACQVTDRYFPGRIQKMINCLNTKRNALDGYWSHQINRGILANAWWVTCTDYYAKNSLPSTCLLLSAPIVGRQGHQRIRGPLGDADTLILVDEGIARGCPPNGLLMAVRSPSSGGVLSEIVENTVAVLQPHNGNILEMVVTHMCIGRPIPFNTNSALSRDHYLLAGGAWKHGDEINVRDLSTKGVAYFRVCDIPTTVFGMPGPGMKLWEGAPRGSIKFVANKARAYALTPQAAAVLLEKAVIDGLTPYRLLTTSDGSKAEFGNPPPFCSNIDIVEVTDAPDPLSQPPLEGAPIMKQIGPDTVGIKPASVATDNTGGDSPDDNLPAHLRAPDHYRNKEANTGAPKTDADYEFAGEYDG